MKKVVFANNYGYYTTDDTNFETRLVSVYNPSRISFKDVRTDKNGKRREKNFQKKTEAQEWLNEQRYLDNRLDSGDMTVNEWYEFWINNYKEGVVKDNTVRNYRQRYQFNIKKEIGNMNLKDVKQSHCQLILNDMAKDGQYSYGTMELTQITMHAIFKGALENDYILKNPAEGLKIKKLTVMKMARES